MRVPTHDIQETYVMGIRYMLVVTSPIIVTATNYTTHPHGRWLRL